jgi:hypothetical protein
MTMQAAAAGPTCGGGSAVWLVARRYGARDCGYWWFDDGTRRTTLIDGSKPGPTRLHVADNGSFTKNQAY